MKWLKTAVKQDVIGVVILSFLLGSVLIWTSGYFTDLHLTADGKLNATLTWLTALAIFWYAYETYQLKKSTSDQVDLQKEIMLNEFLPILEPVANQSLVIKNATWQKLELRNLGKGPAKYVTVHLQSRVISNHLSLAPGEIERVYLDERRAEILPETVADKPERISMKVTYEDIYSRKFQTKNIMLERVGRGNSYRLKQGAWDFWRTSNKKTLANSTKLL